MFIAGAFYFDCQFGFSTYLLFDVYMVFIYSFLNFNPGFSFHLTKHVSLDFRVNSGRIQCHVNASRWIFCHVNKVVRLFQSFKLSYPMPIHQHPAYMKCNIWKVISGRIVFWGVCFFLFCSCCCQLFMFRLLVVQCLYIISVQDDIVIKRVTEQNIRSLSSKLELQNMKIVSKHYVVSNAKRNALLSVEMVIYLVLFVLFVLRRLWINQWNTFRPLTIVPHKLMEFSIHQHRCEKALSKWFIMSKYERFPYIMTSIC